MSLFIQNLITSDLVKIRGKTGFLILCLLTVLVPIRAVIASPVDVEISLYSKATFLAKSGRYKQAAEQYHRLSILFLSSEAKLGRKNMWQYAGLAEALAAIAADKTNSAKAYQYWADSMRYFMTGGTNWDQMKQKLHMRYEAANTQLSTQLQINDFTATIDEHWQNELDTLQAWDEKLNFFSFTSPQLGLVDRQQVGSSSVNLSGTKPQVGYQPPSSSGKKLSGLNNSFTQNKQFQPIVTSVPELPTVPDSSEANVSTVDGALNQIQNQDAKQTEQGKVEQRNKVSGSQMAASMTPARALEAPVLPANPNLVQTKSDPQVEQQDAGSNVVVLPIDEISFNEQASKGKELTEKAPNQGALEQVPAPNKMQNPMAKGNLATLEDVTVTPLQRRSFSPITVESE
ncbi:hypothetical protein [Photobacterium sanguinicancri]|uniref:Uncharacterized protein n=1 Tax=Photobacterium sanguinicancri TaxID=875932 RepID=A0ABX4G183_9GAMM|nr:hypothetical protein [Photobacterium sanguinicancri]OZS44752.1 hypothetical protein ASV53_06595 [Photobacterium sanguinicancri]